MAILGNSVVLERDAVWSGHPRPGEGHVIKLYELGPADAVRINPSASYVNACMDQGPSLGHSGSPPTPSAIYKEEWEALNSSVGSHMGEKKQKPPMALAFLSPTFPW